MKKNKIPKKKKNILKKKTDLRFVKSALITGPKAKYLERINRK